MARKKVLTIQEVARMGQQARMKQTTPEERSAQSSAASTIRWSHLTPEERKKATLPARRARKKKAAARKKQQTAGNKTRRR